MASPPSAAGPTARLAITTFKFAGVATLGLLTGSALSQSTLTAPTLLLLSGPAQGSTALTSLRRSSSRQHVALTRAACLSLLSAWVVSPRGWRHPYLLWTALVTGATAAAAEGWTASLGSLASLGSSQRQANSSPSPSRRGGAGKTTATSEPNLAASEEWEDMMATSEQERAELGLAVDQVNGEAVRLAIARFKRAMGRAAGGYALAFAMALVGLWGDGFVA